MSKFTIKYMVAGRLGYYNIMEDDLDKAKKIFKYTHPSATIMDIVQTTKLRINGETICAYVETN